MNNQTTIDQLESEISHSRNRIDAITRWMLILRRLPELVQSTSISVYSERAFIYVYNREELQKVLALAPLWKKSVNGEDMTYMAKDPELGEIKVVASDSALPATCTYVEETYDVPAVEAKPATTATRRVIKCNTPVADADPLVPSPVETIVNPPDSNE